MFRRAAARSTLGLTSACRSVALAQCGLRVAAPMVTVTTMQHSMRYAATSSFNSSDDWGADAGWEQPPRAPQPAAATRDIPVAEQKPAEAVKEAPKAEPLKVTVTDAKGEPFECKPSTTFLNPDMPFPKWLTSNITRLGFQQPTTIQAYTMPLVMNSHDMIGLAPTGSGKTAAFAVPSLTALGRESTGNPSILVISPTRELSQQTAKVFRELSRGGGVRVREAFGGAPRNFQAMHLSEGCEVLCATPGRLRDFLNTGEASLKDLSFVVFDEADRMLDMGFKPQLEEIMSFIDPDRKVQTMMWSATWPREVQAIAQQFLGKDRLLVRAGSAGQGLQINERIAQKFIPFMHASDRLKVVEDLVEEGEIDLDAKTIVFVDTKRECSNLQLALGQRLRAHGLVDRRAVAEIHGDMSQRARDGVINQFRRGNVKVLVATNVAARGLDFDDVSAVVNYDTPQELDMYCHRIGRTGRAGRHGKAFTFINEADPKILHKLIDYAEKCGQTIPEEVKTLSESSRKHHHMSHGRGRGGGRGFGRGGGRNFGGHRSGGYGGQPRFGRDFDNNDSNGGGGDRFGSSSRSFGGGFQESRESRGSFDQNRQRGGRGHGTGRFSRGGGFDRDGDSSGNKFNRFDRRNGGGFDEY